MRRSTALALTAIELEPRRFERDAGVALPVVARRSGRRRDLARLVQDRPPYRDLGAQSVDVAASPALRALDGHRTQRIGYSQMVVVHRAHGFRFVIYTLDHEPAHVHITGAGQAKINLLGPDGDPELAWSVGIKRSDMRRLFAEIDQRREALLKEWERIHGQLDR